MIYPSISPALTSELRPICRDERGAHDLLDIAGEFVNEFAVFHASSAQANDGEIKLHRLHRHIIHGGWSPDHFNSRECCICCQLHAVE